MILMTVQWGSSAIAAQDQSKLSPEAIKHCLAMKGTVHRMGLLQYEACKSPMPDAGKVCNDSRQCKAGCFFESSNNKPIPSPRKKVTGFCAATDSPFGCRSRVEHGHVGIGVCVD